MVANMKIGKMDGFCVGEPWNARAIADDIGFTSLNTQDIWKDHPEKVCAFTAEFADKNPRTVKAVCMALAQSERYGTPLGQTLRVMAQENRDMRMSEAEKKAAALPPKLTVPMILFFLPVLFVVILGPAAIRVMATQQLENPSAPVNKAK